MDPWKDLGLNKLGRPSEADLMRALSTLRASVNAMGRGAPTVTAKYPSVGIRATPTSQTTFDAKLIHFQVLGGYIEAKSTRTMPKALSVNMGFGHSEIEQVLKDHQKWGEKSITLEDRQKIEQAKQRMIYGAEKHIPDNEKIERLSRLRKELYHLQVKWKASGGKGLWFPDAGRSNQ